MVNKKGFVRTIEAVIAIVILFLFIFTVLPREKQETKIPENIKLVQDKIMNEIESNESIRQAIFGYQSFTTLSDLENSNSRKQISSFIKSSINIPTITFDYSVCNEANIDCAPDFLKTGGVEGLYISLPNKQVYAKSIMLSNVSATTISKVFRLYLWEAY